MQSTTLPLSQVPLFKGIDQAYISEHPQLRTFYTHRLSDPKVWDAVIAGRGGYTAQARRSLCIALEEQYKQIAISEAVAENLAQLREPKTYTITTAHQPCLLTGPLFFIYKIIDTIVLARQLAEQYPDHHFVPVYWMGGEDHDFEEINHLQLFGKRWEWSDRQGGAVGDYKIGTLEPLLQSLMDALGEGVHAERLRAYISTSFSGGVDYGTAALRFVSALFGQYGLVVVDSRSAVLKQAMIPAFQEELLTQPAERQTAHTVARLEALGFKSQAHPRPINLFYLSDNSRERIIEASGGYEVLHTGKVFSREEMLRELIESPQRFSPNVILRPLYQETVLPNLAYVGGGGEIAYWLQLQSTFAHFNQPFPLLVRRSAALWLDATHSQRYRQWGFDRSPDLLWLDGHSLANYWVRHQVPAADLSLAAEAEAWNQAFDALAQRVAPLDATLVGQLEAQRQAQLQWLDKLEKRLLKAEKQRHDTTIQQIQRWKEKLFPNEGLQERWDSFIGLYLRHGDALFEWLLGRFAPLEKRFYVFEE